MAINMNGLLFGAWAFTAGAGMAESGNQAARQDAAMQQFLYHRQQLILLGHPEAAAALPPPPAMVVARAPQRPTLPQLLPTTTFRGTGKAEMPAGDTREFVLFPNGEHGPMTYAGTPPAPPSPSDKTVKEAWDQYHREKKDELNTKTTNAVAKFFKGAVLGAENGLRNFSNKRCDKYFHRLFPELMHDTFMYSISCKYFTGVKTCIGEAFLSDKHLCFMPLSKTRTYTFIQPLSQFETYAVASDNGIMMFTECGGAFQFQDFDAGTATKMGSVWGTVKGNGLDIFTCYFDKLWRASLPCAEPLPIVDGITPNE